MRLLKNNRNSSLKRVLLLSISVILVILGLLMAFDNMNKFTMEPLRRSTENGTNQLLKAEENNAIKTTAQDQNKKTMLYSERPEIGAVLGELYIPKLDSRISIYEGTAEEELASGVGHYSDSVLPGEEDNSVLSGHRDTVFRNLGELGVGDELIVQTSAGEFIYKVNKVRIVDKEDRTVIVPKPRATLTVTTCYPFTYISSAPQRFVLVAYLASQTLK